MGGPNFPWWKYISRPQPSLRDYDKLTERLESAEGISYEIGIGNRTIKYKNNSIEGVQLAAASHDYYKVWKFDFESGRYFTDNESKSGRPIAIIGFSIADGLFPNEERVSIGRSDTNR